VPRKSLQIILLVVLLMGLPLTGHAQDRARLPYSIVSSYLELFKSLEHLGLIFPSMMIASTNPEVPPQSVEFKISTSSGWQTFIPDENGVIEFPDQPEWAELILLSNQPKGTLQLVIGFAARPLASTRMNYQDLMGLVPQFDEALTALADLQGQPPTKVTGLTIQLPEKSGATLNLLTQKGKQTLKSYSSGVVVIKYDQGLWQENPPVEFDELPIGIVPLR